MRFRQQHILSTLALLLLCGCDPTKRLAEGEYLLKQNHVRVTAPGPNGDELASIIKQKPNKRILGVPIYLGFYNLRDPQEVAKIRQEKDSLCAVKNADRMARGKRERQCDHATRERTSEPPVILDTNLIHRSAEQIRLYMNKEGWFQADVRDTIHYSHRKLFQWNWKRGRRFKQQKAEVEFIVDPGPYHRFRNIRYSTDDDAIRSYVASSWEQSLLHKGDRFDTDVLDAERERIAHQLREEGLLFFTKELIVYVADTAVGNDEVDIHLRMERTYAKEDRGLRGTPEGTVYTIGDVTIVTSRGPLATMDTTLFQGYRILHNGPLRYRPKALVGAIFLLPDQRYRQSDGDNTYRRLSGLQVFDRVDLAYDTTGIGELGIANARIGLLPGKPQSVTTEAYATNRGGFLGTTISLGYRHRNLFRSLGYIKAQMNFGFEAQQSFTNTDGASQAGANLTRNTLFNTLNFGPEVTIGFPRPFAKLFSKSSGSRMLFNGVYNYQQRPDFTRTLARGSVGFEWNETPSKVWGLYFTDLSVIKIPSKSEAFQNFLQQTNDPVFTNSYTDHLIINIPRITYTWNTQVEKKRRTNFFLRSTGESAGTVLSAFRGRSDQLNDTLTGREYRTLFGIRYAEYFKFDNDFRINHTIHDRSSIAFRVAAGIGVPYGNLEVLPFESSFFSGGANGMRAWRARSLGPGSYSAPLVAFDRIGEIRIEANFEYRFKLISYLEGALFTDVGNIWNRRKDPRRPGAEFEFNDFLSELAVGTGVGARLNFDFFIVRFDLGMQTKDPSLPNGERWLFQPKEEYEARLTDLTGRPYNYRTQFNFNLGIGYPF